MTTPSTLHPELPLLRLTFPLPRSSGHGSATDWPDDLEEALKREWLVTNGQGSYASGSVAWANTRRYHGVFIPCLPSVGRTVMLPRLCEQLEAGGVRHRLDVEERADGTAQAAGLPLLRSFTLRGLVPEWELEVAGVRLRRRLVFVHGENTVYVGYEHLEGPGGTLLLRPFPAFRPHDRPIVPCEPQVCTALLHGERVQLAPSADGPPLCMRVFSQRSAPFVGLVESSPALCLRVEKARGLDHEDRQCSPGYFACAIGPGESVFFAVTCEGWSALERDPRSAFELELSREQRLLERAPAAARTGTAARLVLAADQFIIDPVVRPADEAWARATGQDARSVIAGYHWFTDWGRDTMISLEGLTLSTGRYREAAAILRTFQHYVRDGLLPNLFPEGGRQGLYHTADATLWYFHAIDRYLEVTDDEVLLRDLFPTLSEIVSRHLAGTRFHIRVDPGDGLLSQGEEGYQLTWMDAKVDGWVVTPRRGKAVELNALWFNALRLMADWSAQLGADPGPYLGHAERAYTSFNRRFWNEAEGCLFDVVDAETGDDPAVRPNQVLAVSLRHPVLFRERWAKVVEKVRAELLTPVGLRTLSPRHPDYKPRYDGDLRARDAAYHQGTVWVWLLGHFVDAQLRLDPDGGAARSLLHDLEGHLLQGCVGQVSEIFDATAPFRARGCVAQAWSVAETLRAFLRSER